MVSAPQTTACGRQRILVKVGEIVFQIGRSMRSDRLASMRRGAARAVQLPSLVRTIALIRCSDQTADAGIGTIDEVSSSMIEASRAAQ
jgi:hypothetical protein